MEFSAHNEGGNCYGKGMELSCWRCGSWFCSIVALDLLNEPLKVGVNVDADLVADKLAVN